MTALSIFNAIIYIEKKKPPHHPYPPIFLSTDTTFERCLPPLVETSLPFVEDFCIPPPPARIIVAQTNKLIRLIRLMG